MKKELQADLALILVAASWGASNYMITLCEEWMGPLCLNAWRFGVASLIVCLLGFKHLLKMNLVTLKYAFGMGVFLAGCYISVNYGVVQTTISNSGFFCGLSVIFIPFGEWICFHKRPERKVFLVVIIATIGVFLMSMKGDFSFNTAHLRGDLLCMFCALSYTFNVLICDKALLDKRCSAYNLGAVQLVITFIICGLGTATLESFVIPSSKAIIAIALFLGIFCTGIPFIVQPIAMQYTSGTKVGVIFTLEPVLCAIIAFFLVGERLSPINYIGMFLLLVCILAMEIDFSEFAKKKQ